MASLQNSVTSTTDAQAESMHRKMSPNTARIMLIINAAVWGSGYTLLKMIQDTIPTQWMMAIRMFLAIVVMGLVFLPHLMKLGLRRYVIPGLILAVTYWAGYMLQLTGLKDMAPGRNTFLVDTYCVMVPFFVWAFTKRRPTWQHIAAAVICIVGIGFVSLGGDGAANLLSVNFADAITIASAVFYAINMVNVGMLGARFDAIGLVMMEFFWCFVLFLVGAVLTEGAPSLTWARWDIALGYAYLVIGSTVIGQIFQTVAIQSIPTSQASVLLSTECIFGVIASMLFYHERLAPRSVIGFVLIFGAILLSQIQLKKRHHTQSA